MLASGNGRASGAVEVVEQSASAPGVGAVRIEAGGFTVGRPLEGPAHAPRRVAAFTDEA